MLHRGRRNLGKRSRRQKIDETRARNALGRLLIWTDPFIPISRERRSGQLAAAILPASRVTAGGLGSRGLVINFEPASVSILKTYCADRRSYRP